MNYLFIFILLIFLTKAQGSPLLDLFFGNPREHKSSYGRKSRGRSSGGGYNDYKRICKVLNPDPYAFIGSNPYPAAPFCPP